jgi:23S rRNA (adenine2030-N6)-methyltransferase
MFSYRHGFHAGNHADVLKHTVLIAILRHLTAKPTAVTVVDTHAGAGLYRLDDDFTATSGEAAEGIFKLREALAPEAATPLVKDYLELVASFNAPGQTKIYPGSPFVTQSLLREPARDKLWLFEMHPTDSKALITHVEQLPAKRQVTVQRVDGFEGLRSLLPPPSRRGLVLIDPSYEIKNDYAKVAACIQDSLKRFATGTYMVWYPVIPRPEAHELPRRLKTLTNQAGRTWLHATLAIGQADHRPGEGKRRQGLTASGVFVVNPPHTLKAGLRAALPQLLEVLGRGRGMAQSVEASA